MLALNLACSKLWPALQFGYGEEMQGITPDEVWSKVVQNLREVPLSVPLPPPPIVWGSVWLTLLCVALTSGVALTDENRRDTSGRKE